jgi:hypothetical protein
LQNEHQARRIAESLAWLRAQAEPTWQHSGRWSRRGPLASAAAAAALSASITCAAAACTWFFQIPESIDRQLHSLPPGFELHGVLPSGKASLRSVS